MAFFREPYPEDVVNRVLHEYAAQDVADVLRILQTVKGVGHPEDVEWLQLACLRLAGGKKELIPQWVELANTDSRDLSMWLNRLHGPGWERDYILYSERQH